MHDKRVVAAAATHKEFKTTYHSCHKPVLVESVMITVLDNKVCSLLYICIYYRPSAKYTLSRKKEKIYGASGSTWEYVYMMGTQNG